MANGSNNELEVKKHVFDVKLATELNVLAAAVFNTLIFWVQHNERTGVNFYDGKNWTYLSLADFTKKMFPYATKMQIRTALSNLEAADYILSRVDEEKQEHPKYYTITDKGRNHYNATVGTDNEYHKFNVRFACEYGITAAVLFENIYLWVQHNQMADEHYKDGMYWTYSTKKSMLDFFKYMSEPTLKKHIDKLVKENVLFTEKVDTFSAKGSWYAITPKGDAIYNGFEYDDTKEITHDTKEITHDTKEITHDTKEITPKDKSIKDIFNKDISMRNISLSNNLTANEDLQMVMPLNNRIVGMCRKALNRDFSYSEKQIILDLIEKQTPIEVIELAIRDNEFRGAALSVAHIDASIKAWADAGCTTPTEIERYILVTHSHNIEKKFGTGSQAAANTTEIKCREAVKDIERAYTHQQYHQMRLAYDTAIDCGLPVDKYLTDRVKTTLSAIAKTTHKVEGPDRHWLEFVNATLTRFYEAGDYERLRAKYVSFVESRPDENINLEDYVSEEILSKVRAS